MTAQLRNPFIMIIAVISFAVLLLINPTSAEPTDVGLELTASLSFNEIQMGENTTLTVDIENHAETPMFFALKLRYTNRDFLFYDPLTNTNLDDLQGNDFNYTLTHPTTGVLDKATTIPIIITGPMPKGSSETFRIVIEVYAIYNTEKIKADEKVVMLTVNFA